MVDIFGSVTKSTRVLKTLLSPRSVERGKAVAQVWGCMNTKATGTGKKSLNQVEHSIKIIEIKYPKESHSLVFIV